MKSVIADAHSMLEYYEEVDKTESVVKEDQNNNNRDKTSIQESLGIEENASCNVSNIAQE